MKIFITLTILLICLISCNREGEITKQSKNPIEINGKKYRFLKIVPAENENSVWILIPNDADVNVPGLTSYTFTSGTGKHQTTHYVNCLFINQ